MPRDARKIECNVVSTHRVAVRQDVPIMTLLDEARLDVVDSDVDSAQPTSFTERSGETDVALVTFRQSISSEQVIPELTKRGYRPATASQLLALAAQFPNLQKRFLIVGLGSLWKDDKGKRVLCLGSSNGVSRTLRLCWFEDWSDWLEGCHFACVRRT